MCFNHDGAGQINFGDAGIRDQADPTYYNVSFTSINVDNELVPVEFTAVMDSGTSFTYLNDPEYTALATNFNSQIRRGRANFSASSGPVSFEYCYGLSPSQTEVVPPEVRLTTEGGALFPVTRPFIIFADEITGEVRYCLAIQKSDFSVNVTGQNFMTGLKVVFDRERSVLGWQKFDCYKNAKAADAPDRSSSAAPAPTTITPQQNDSNNWYPGAARAGRPRDGRWLGPRSAGSRHAARALGGISLLLLPLLATALV